MITFIRDILKIILLIEVTMYILVDQALFRHLPRQYLLLTIIKHLTHIFNYKQLKMFMK